MKVGKWASIVVVIVDLEECFKKNYNALDRIELDDLRLDLSLDKDVRELRALFDALLNKLIK